jgi:hypothetical protein
MPGDRFFEFSEIETILGELLPELSNFILKTGRILNNRHSINFTTFK